MKNVIRKSGRIQVDPGLAASSHQDDRADDFLAIGPALRILQLNVEGLSASKRSVIANIADSKTYNNCTQLTIAQFTGWRRRRKKHSRNETTLSRDQPQKGRCVYVVKGLKCRYISVIRTSLALPYLDVNIETRVI